MKQHARIFLEDIADATLRKKIEFETANLNSLINNISGVLWSVDRDYNLITCNNAFDIMVESMSGRKIERGESVFVTGFTEQQLRDFKKYYDRALAGETFTIEEYNETYDRWYDISFYPVRQGYEVVGTACSSHDITQRKNAAAQINEAKRAYAFASEINQAIIYARNEQELLDSVAGIAVATGGFKVTLVSRIEKAHRKLSVIAHANILPDELTAISTIYYQPDGPYARIVETRHSHIINEISAYPEHAAFWAQYDTLRNMRSVISLPLTVSGEITYLMCLISDKENIFNKEEVKLLEKSAANISYALANIEKERLRLIAEHKLKTEERRQRQAEQIAHLGSWHLDLATGLATWSDEHCRIFGVPETNNVHDQASWLAFIHPDDVEYVLGKRKEMENGSTNSAYYYRIIRPDGNVRYIYRESQLQYDETGKATGVYGIALDVTGKRLAEEKLKHSAFRFNQAQSITHLGSWELNYAANIGIWSEECCRIYGLSVHDNIQTYESWLATLHPDDANNVLAEVQKLNNSIPGISFQHRIIRPDGTIRHLHTQAYTELGKDGQPIGLYGTSHDITDQVANIEQLKAQNEQLKQIAWTQSHKVRGPLSTILGLSQLFHEERPVEEIRDIVQGILLTSEKLDKVIREIVGQTDLAEVRENIS